MIQVASSGTPLELAGRRRRGITGSSSAAVATGFAAAVLADSPVLYPRLNEPSGATMNDSSGNARNGSYVNAPTLGVAGALTDGTTAATFNGTTQCGTVVDQAGLHLGDTFSLEAWIKRSATQSANQHIISKGNSSYAFRMGTANNLELIKAGVAVIVASTTTITDTTGYHHVVATKTGAACKLYIDSVDVTGTITNATCVDNTKTLRIAADGDISDIALEFFSGTIDECVVYGTVLSAARVTAHFNAR